MSEEILPGALYVVSTPIGNLDDITRRAIHILKHVDLIAAEDTRRTRQLLKHLSIDRPLTSYHSYNERRRVPELLKKLSSGQAVAIVTDAGTPGISDPAFQMIREAVDQGVRVVPVPGASAVLPALVVSGLPTDRFVFEGFLPTKKGRRARIEELVPQPRTIVLFESPHRVKRTLEDLQSALGDRQVAVVREITKKFEEVFRGTLSEARKFLEQRSPRGEYVLVVAGNPSRRQTVSQFPSRLQRGKDGGVCDEG
jgi:16S rRNA (cytidine1402-2'-O)-methyltransferase